MSYSLLSSPRETYDFGNGCVAYKHGGMVTITGYYTIDASNSHPMVGTLPAGWRPSSYQASYVLISVVQSGGYPPYIDVSPNGDVYIESHGHVGQAFPNITIPIA